MKRWLTLILSSILIVIPQIVSAQSTLLPSIDETIDCQELLTDEALTYNLFFQQGSFEGKISSDQIQGARNDILGCAIKTGMIRIWMIPYFITYFANFFIGIAGTISVLFVVLGGFWYMTGGVMDDKEKGKKTILYALIGLSITLLAWIIVNVIQVQVSS